jgi:hypothetical protein
MSVGQAKLLRKRMPRVFAFVKNGDWVIDGATGNGHIWLRHRPTGKRVVAPSSGSDMRAERNLLRYMRQIDGGQ